MKYASSLLYGGMLVDAEKSDYKDYARLLLRCPFCGEAVFLVAAKHREEHVRKAPKSGQLVAVKASEVKPAFSHFPGVASSTCELRSSKINSSFIARCISKSRNQRLKIFQNNFGRIFEIENSNIGELDIKIILRKANQILLGNYVKIIHDAEKDAREDFKRRFTANENLDEFKALARDICESAVKDPDKALIMNENISEAKVWLESVEIDMHLNIVYEVINFLATKSASPLVDKIFDKGLYLWGQSYMNQNNSHAFYSLFTMTDCKNYKKLGENYKVIITGILGGAVAFLCGIPWANFIKDCQKKVS